jgi:uncharacterized membrane protein YfcA
MSDAVLILGLLVAIAAAIIIGLWIGGRIVRQRDRDREWIRQMFEDARRGPDD